MELRPNASRLLNSTKNDQLSMDICINSEGERATVNQILVILRPVGDGVKRLAHDANLKGMVVIRSPSLQLVPLSSIDLGNNASWELST
jgi:hypothetical protein